MGNEKRGWDDSLISLGLGALVVVVSGILLYNFFSTSSRDLLADLSNSMNQQTSSTQTGPSPEVSTNPTAVEQVAGIVTPLPEETVPPTARPTAKATATPRAVAQATPTMTAIPTQIARATQAPTATPQVAQATATPAAVAVASPTVTTSTEGTVRDAYTVVKGDSLWKIAERFYGSGYDWKKIQAENNLAGKSLEIGMTISVPRQGMASSTSTVAQNPDTTVTPSQPSDQPAVGGATPVSGETTYTVVRGDNLSTIVSRACGTTTSWIKIAQDNKLANPRIIHAGNVLRIQCTR